MSKFNIEVEIPFGDNAYAIMGTVQKALKKAGATQEQLSEYFSESTSGDYNHLISVQSKWVICV